MNQQTQLQQAKQWARRLMPVIVLGLVFLTACSPPSHDPYTEIACEWVVETKAWVLLIGSPTVGMGVAAIAAVYWGGGIIGDRLYSYAEDWKMKLIIGGIVLLVGFPLLGALMEAMGGPACAYGWF